MAPVNQEASKCRNGEKRTSGRKIGLQMQNFNCIDHDPTEPALIVPRRENRRALRTCCETSVPLVRL